jgi:hypothetical protein
MIFSAWRIWFFYLTGLILLSCVKETAPGKIAVLKEVTDPGPHLWISQNRLFVANATDSLKRGNTVQIYALRDGKLQNQLGGPEVFKVQPAHSVVLFFQPDKFVVNSSGKVSVYNHHLELIQEKAHGQNSFFYVPWRNKFIAREIYVEDSTEYYRLNIYDSDLNLVQELCRKEFSGRAFFGDFSFSIYKDELYVSKIRDDFNIEVFDEEGKNIRSISHDCPRIKVTQEHQDHHLSKLTGRPGWERYFNSRGEMEAYYKNLIRYPEYFPAIQCIHLADDKIFVFTGNQIEDKREIWILDLSGNIINKVMIPFRMRSLRIAFPYTVHDNKLYQLIPNDQTDRWELYSLAII